MEKIPKAIPFIEISNEGEFSVNVESMSILQSIGNKQVAPLVIGGPWRSGKSFLANRLIGSMKGFQIGSTVKACTKGIWMWSEPIPLGENIVALILDAEGLNSTERTVQTDTKLFSLSLLLASMFIYNCRGHISENALEDLSSVSNLTQFIHIKKTENEKGLEFNKYFPSLIWILRDFSLDLQKKLPRDYLEENLKSQIGISEDILKKNEIRKTISSFFTDRDCFTLVRPINDEAKIAHIEDLNYTDLRPDFTKGMDTLISKIFNKLKGKIINGTPVTGNIYLSLAIDYVASMNDNDTPTILPTLERVLMAEARKLTEQIFEDFINNLNSTMPKDTFPIDEKNFKERVSVLVNGINMRLLKDLKELLSNQEYIEAYSKFQNRISEEAEKYSDENNECSFEICMKLIENLFSNIQFPQISNVDQMSELIILQFQKEWEKLLTDYEKLSKGPEKNKALIAGLLGAGKFNIISSYSELMRKVIEIFNQNRSVMNGVLSEMQSSEKKWKALVANNEKIIAEKNNEKEELLRTKNELELKIEKLTRDLKNKDFEIKSKENYQTIEISSFKNLTESQVKDKNNQIESLNRKNESLKQKIKDLEGVNQKLSYENSTLLTKLENQSKMLEQTMDETKKNLGSSQKQLSLNNLFKSIREVLEELKSHVNHIEEISKLKTENLQLKRDISEKDYACNKKILELKKDHVNEVKEVKHKFENDFASLKNDYESLKNAENGYKDKVSLFENRMKSLNKKVDLMKADANSLSESLKIKEQLVLRQKNSIEMFGKSEESLKFTYEKLQTDFGLSKAELLIKNEEIEALINLMVEVVKKIMKMPSCYNDAYREILTENTKKIVKDRLSVFNISFN